MTIYKNLLYEVQNSGVPQVYPLQLGSLGVSHLNLNPGATLAVVAWRLPPHCGRQAQLEGGMPHLHHDPQQDQRLL